MPRKRKNGDPSTVPLDASASAESAAAEAQPAVENSDVDLDEDGGTDSYDSLVAAVAEMSDEPEGRAPAGNVRPPERDADVEESEEIHDLDEADAPDEGIDPFIAEVGRGAPAQQAAAEPEDEPTIIDLDEDVPAVTSLAGPELSRLARAAASGGVDESEPRAIPLDVYGDVSTPEARARLLAQALAHAEHKEARYRVPVADTRRSDRWKSVGAAAVLVLAGVVAVAPPAWVRADPPAQLSEPTRERGIHLALLLQAQQVEAYRVRNQQLPASLDDLPMRLGGLRYARSGRSYQLVGFTPRGDAIVYDAADPAPEFRALVETLMPPHEPAP